MASAGGSAAEDRGDAQQHVFEIRERRDVDQCAALEERIEECGAAGALEAAGKQPVLAAECDDAQLILGAIVINGQPTVIDESLQGRPLIRELGAC